MCDPGKSCPCQRAREIEEGEESQLCLYLTLNLTPTLILTQNQTLAQMLTLTQTLDPDLKSGPDHNP